MYPKVQIKGIKDGLLVTLGEGTWEEVHLALLEQIDQQGEFLKGARLAVDVGNLVLKAAEIGQLQKELVNRELNLLGGFIELSFDRTVSAILWACHANSQASTNFCFTKARQ